MNPLNLPECVVSTTSHLSEVCAQLATSNRLALDTEFVGEDSYHPRVCLIQIATSESLYLIDPFEMDSIEALWHLIADPQRQIVVHAGREELRMCRLGSGQTPANFFDVQIAAGLVGMGYPLSHTGLVNQILGIRLGAAQTLTEWRNRPLTPEQVEYALDDVRFLLAIADKLSDLLESLKRVEWAEEEFELMIARALDEGESGQREKWRKIRGVGSLSRRDLAAVRELYTWRDRKAEALNRPPRSVLRDDLLVAVVRRRAKSNRDLYVIRGIPKKHIDAMFEIVEKARELPLDDCPIANVQESDWPQEGILTSLLNAVLANWANREQVAANLIASGQDVKRAVRDWVRNGKLPANHGLLQGWRSRHVLPELLAVLTGDSLIRVGDVKRSHPLDVDPR